MAITKPSNTFTRPFAESGSKNTIPANSLIGTTAGAASLADGFPPLTMTPLAAGGVPPSGKDMNGILNQISQHTAWGNAGGNYQFDSLIAAAGGYPVGATVYSNDWSASYRNVVAGNAVDFNAVPSSIGVSWLASPFIKQSGGNMSGVFRANAGTGLNAGIKGASDTDTGIEWLQDGVIQTVINGVVRQKSDGATTQIMSADKRMEFQGNGNIVLYNAANNPVWDAFNTYQKSESDAKYSTLAQRAADMNNINATFVNVAGGNMSGVFRANAGTGLNAGIKGASDTDTGIEWLQDGVLQTVINGVVRQKSDGATTLIMSADKRFAYQGNGDIVSYDASNNVLWNAFATVTQAQRNADNVYNDATFVSVTGDTMTGVLRTNMGTGLNAGIKGAVDTDTGFEWLSEGVLQTVINGVVRQKSDGATTQIMSADKRFEYQANGNIVSYDPSNNALWNAFNTYQKSDYSGSVGAGWYRTPHPSIATGIIKQWGITTAMGQDSTLAVSFPIAFPNSCNFVVLTENGVMDGSGSGSMSVDLVTSSGFTIRKGTDVSHTVRWVAEGY